MHAPLRSRRSQQERSAEARRRLREATILCLAEHGYHGTTTPRVAGMAGMSRGAMQHHYPSRIELVADAAEQLLDAALARTIQAAQRLQPGTPAPMATLVRQLWTRLVDNPRYAASLEVFVAVRSDAALRARVAPTLARLSRTLAAAMGTLFRPRRAGDDPALLIGMTFALLRGLALEAGLYRDRAALEQALDQWASMLDERLELARESAPA